MSTTAAREATIGEAEQLVGAAEDVMQTILAHGKAVTQNGRAIDDHQVLAQRIAYAATELRAARELVSYAQRAGAAGHGSAELESMAVAFAAEIVQKLRSQIEASPESFGVDEATLRQKLS